MEVYTNSSSSCNSNSSNFSSSSRFSMETSERQLLETRVFGLWLALLRLAGYTGSSTRVDMTWCARRREIHKRRGTVPQSQIQSTLVPNIAIPIDVPTIAGCEWRAVYYPVTASTQLPLPPLPASVSPQSITPDQLRYMVCAVCAAVQATLAAREADLAYSPDNTAPRRSQPLLAAFDFLCGAVGPVAVNVHHSAADGSVQKVTALNIVDEGEKIEDIIYIANRNIESVS